MSLEYVTVGKCANQLQCVLRDDKDLSRYLFGEGFITDEFYEEVLDPRST